MKKKYKNISLLLGKCTKMFVPKFPEIPQMLYFPTPLADENKTSQGFPGTEGHMFWYISLKAMKYLLCYIFLVNTLEQSF